MKSITSPEVLIRVRDILANSDIKEEDLTFISRAILDTYMYETELREKITHLNMMNEENYNKYCEALIKLNEEKK